MRILVVDDEEDARVFLRELLLQAGHDVTVAANAVEAMVYVRIYAFDLILLDITMPGMDGHQLAQSLSGAWDTFEIPLFVISCRTDSESKAWAKLNGCLRYIEKPFEPTDLLDEIDELEQRQSREKVPHA